MELVQELLDSRALLVLYLVAMAMCHSIIGSNARMGHHANFKQSFATENRRNYLEANRSCQRSSLPYNQVSFLFNMRVITPVNFTA